MSPERFTAMGVEVVVGGARANELEDVRGLFALWDRTFSPFLPDSELAHVNTRETRLVTVSPLFSRVLDVALEAARLTDGLVDPTFGSPAEDWTTLRLTGPLLGRRPGTTLDLNGVVKGSRPTRHSTWSRDRRSSRRAATSQAAESQSSGFRAEDPSGSRTAA